MNEVDVSMHELLTKGMLLTHLKTCWLHRFGLSLTYQTARTWMGFNENATNNFSAVQASKQEKISHPHFTASQLKILPLTIMIASTPSLHYHNIFTKEASLPRGTSPANSGFEDPSVPCFSHHLQPEARAITQHDPEQRWTPAASLY
jgi:hypothetical protein